MQDIRILSIPGDEFMPSHGNGFIPYKNSPDVWVLQVRMVDRDTVTDWVSVPVIKYVNNDGK